MGQIAFMKHGKLLPIHLSAATPASAILAIAIGLFQPFILPCVAQQPSAQALAAFDTYSRAVEGRLAAQHRSSVFVAGIADARTAARLRRGELIIEKLTPAHGPELPGAMLHHWRGTAFAPGATVADFEQLMRNFSAYPRRYAPEVISARVLVRQGDRYQVAMRVEQKHLITVVMDTSYDVAFNHLDPQHGYSVSRSTRIAEIAQPGTASERPLRPDEEHGFLWRLNTYWTYEQRDGGLYLQIETVSLTRAVPTGLGWAVGPFVESVPRDSMEFTLQRTCEALRRTR
jgi:hypothetical protein